MKVTGDSNLFAIQWALVCKEGMYSYGKFCFWIGGNRIGNFDEITTISVCISYLKDFIKNKPFRQYNNSFALEKEDLFHKLYKKNFLSGTIADQSYLKVGDLRETFWLDEVGEYSFMDKVGIIMLDEIESNRQRFIWQTFDGEAIYEYFVPLNFFEMVANEFIDKCSDLITSLPPCE